MIGTTILVERSRIRMKIDILLPITNVYTSLEHTWGINNSKKTLSFPPSQFHIFQEEIFMFFFCMFFAVNLRLWNQFSTPLGEFLFLFDDFVLGFKSNRICSSCLILTNLVWFNKNPATPEYFCFSSLSL